MIEKLSIQNFQAHNKTTISFDPAITCIIGPSDSGKSAIIRALRWVCTNQPGGTSFIKHGEKGCSVKLIIGGKTITRKRSANDNINEYALGKEEYKAFGRGIPDPILKAVNMNSICWQGQHDSPYWFGLTAGEVSRQLNSIVDLGIIDNTLSAIAKVVNKSSTAFEIAQENSKTAESNFKDLEWVPEFSKDTEKLVIKGRAASKKLALASSIKLLYSNIKQHNYEYVIASEKTTSLKSIINLGSFALRISKQRNSIKSTIKTAKESKILAEKEIPNMFPVQSAITKYHKLTRETKLLHDLITEARQLHKTEKEEIPDTSIMQKAIKNHKEAQTKIKLLQSLMTDIKTREEELVKHRNILKEIKERIPNICPTCKQPLK